MVNLLVIVTDVLNKLITKEITTHITLELMETSFNGHAYKCETPVFSYEHYGIIAKHCLEWALCNPVRNWDEIKSYKTVF